MLCGPFEVLFIPAADGMGDHRPFRVRHPQIGRPQRLVIGHLGAVIGMEPASAVSHHAGSHLYTDVCGRRTEQVMLRRKCGRDKFMQRAPERNLVMVQPRIGDNSIRQRIIKAHAQKFMQHALAHTSG